MEENKVLRAQLELAQVKQEIDRRVAEKEDEFNNTRKNHARAMDSIGASFETEARAKAQITEQVGISERKAASLSGEVEESKALLDGADRAQRQLQGDIADARGA